MRIEMLAPLLDVTDVDRSISFYTKALSFQVAEKTSSAGRSVRAVLRNGPATLILQRQDHLQCQAQQPPAGSRGPALYITVESARDCHAPLSASGVAASEVRLEGHGMEEFRLRDPDGHEIVVGSRAMRIA
jgi:catechol 2,3-dioxygenase-like lactoylglutathione lyase family enzyme